MSYCTFYSSGDNRITVGSKEEFEDFYRKLESYMVVYDLKSMDKIFTKLIQLLENKKDFFYIDEKSTKMICRWLDHCMKDNWCLFVDMMLDEYNNDKEGNENLILGIVKIAQFHCFIKNTRSDFVIYKN